MSLGNILGQKSQIVYTRDTVNKTYHSFEGKKPRDVILRASSSPESPRASYNKERRILEVLTQIPDQKRFSPRLISYDEKPPVIQIERIYGTTFLDKINVAFQEGTFVNTAIESVPYRVALLHKQLQAYQENLLRDVTWKTSGKDIQGLKFRTKVERERRVWHYLRAIIYSMSPDLEELRERGKISASETRTKYNVINRDIKKYLERKKGIDSQEFKRKFVDRHYKIMYGSSDITAQDLLTRGKIHVIHGDLGPQHLYTNGRCIDFDEARLDVGVEDLVASMYNMFIYPQGSGHERGEKELALTDLSLKYLEAMLEREPSKEEKAGFVMQTTEARLYEMLRLFATDCKALPSQLRRFVDGNPRYEKVENQELRSTIIKDYFLNGLEPFLRFWGHEQGWQSLAKYEGALTLKSQLNSVEDILTSTHVFDAVSDHNFLEGFEELIS